MSAGEVRWRERSPAAGVFAEFVSPAEPSLAETHPAAVRWRNLRLDPDLVGVCPAEARPTRIEIHGEAGTSWRLPVADPLPAPLAWHPVRPLVAGLALNGRRAYPWVANHELRTFRAFDHVRAALSCVENSSPLAWFSDLLTLLTPGRTSPPEEPAHGRPIAVEASGPGFVDFQPGIGELAAIASVRVTTLNIDTAVLTPLTGPLLLNRFTPLQDCLYIEYADATSASEELSWREATVWPDAPGTLRPAQLRQRPEFRAGVQEFLPTGPAEIGTDVFPGQHATVLWLNDVQPGAHFSAPGMTGHKVVNLDLSLRWPSDATAESLRAQITAVVGAALESLDGPVIVAGHSFGATLALYVLARFPEFRAAIAHSGCYNRTLTPAGFQHEKRSYWAAPEVYREFSAIDFADRLDRPVLLVHGTEDANPATPVDQAVQFYRALVAAGGHARLVLLPHEDHTFVRRENREFLAGEHRSWIERWSRC
ncbi:alpha/beta hydrolase family protein [Amycolatopsis alba]|uniref:alpha/beta hydrolase family protein n=1 Tax=Amycolatopsis alba TaxID=76020 RepID=UPI000369341F|nr:prolyl oligopeptidase family serine peptidase [Amycolatopsis alba]